MNNKIMSLGFTLVELLIISAILAIIAMICIPHFQSILARAEAKKVSATLRSVIRDSKYQAFVHKQRIAICGSSDGESCNAQTWSKGLLIFNDTTPNRKRDADEKIINIIKYDLKYGQLKWQGFGTSGNIIFHSDSGLPRGSNGSFVYCAINPKNHKRLTLSSMGNVNDESITTC